MTENFDISSKRREDFEFAWNIAFGESAQRLSMKALELFTAAGVSKNRMAEVEMEIQNICVLNLKKTFPEFSQEIDERLRKERN
jgi:hypothetical protein